MSREAFILAIFIACSIATPVLATVDSWLEATSATVISPGGTVAYDVWVEVTGDNQGAANLVFDIELRDEVASAPGELLDGGASRPSVTPAVITHPDGFNIGGNGPGSVVVAADAGGPGQDYYTTGTPVPGVLLGPGSGYSWWVSPDDDPVVYMSAGVGRTDMLGVKALYHGEVTFPPGIPLGDYYIGLVPAAGINVLKSGIDLSHTITGGFAETEVDVICDNVDQWLLVTVEAPPVPAVSEWGLMLISLLLLTAGTVIVARQRSACEPCAAAGSACLP